MPGERAPFRRILLAFNPAAGPRHKDQRNVDALTQFLRDSGIEACQVTLGSEGLAGINQDIEVYDAIFLCGGDGTINRALQHLIARRSQIPIGIVPTGSGNLFAGSLGTPRTAVSALKMLLRGEHRRVSVGTILRNGTPRSDRYWIAAAGIGADARVICSVKAHLKAQFGIAAYYAESVRQLFSPRLELAWFRVEFTDRSGTRRSELVTQVIAERMAYFGNAVVRPTEDLADDEMRLVLIKSASRWPYLRFGISLVTSRLKVPPLSGRNVEVAIATEVSCFPLCSSNSYHENGVLAEVDGELIGNLPVHLRVQPQAVTVIIPATQGS